jgi:large subunit ribosomal protein L3
MKGIIGKKLGMTRIFNEKGESVPVTVIEAGPCPVVEVKTEDSDGYNAIQIGFGRRKPANVNMPTKGHFEKAGVGPTRVLREIRVNDPSGYEVGNEIKADLFQAGDLVRVTGYTKGKGFQGVVKRWGFSGSPDSHGSRNHREPGSIGQCATPAKVWKNRKMPGQAGHERITVRNLEVIQVDADRNIIAVRGAVPGHKNGYVMLSAQE